MARLGVADPELTRLKALNPAGVARQRDLQPAVARDGCEYVDPTSVTVGSSASGGRSAAVEAGVPSIWR
jgi:hypothetical protein